MATYTVTLALTDLQERALRNRKTREGRDAVPNQTYLEAAAAPGAGAAVGPGGRGEREGGGGRRRGAEPDLPRSGGGARCGAGVRPVGAGLHRGVNDAVPGRGDADEPGDGRPEGVAALAMRRVLTSGLVLRSE